MKEKQTDFYNGRVWIFIGWHGLVLEFFRLKTAAIRVHL